MKFRTLLLAALGACLSTVPALAEGAGGVEFLQVIGQDLWNFPGRSSLPATTGQIQTAGGFGWGTDDHGTLSGGFGLGLVSEDGRTPRGGFGGVMNGWHRSWGPISFQALDRIGFGGLDRGHGNAGFALLGTLEAQVGLLVLPWFELGVTGGAAGTVTMAPGHPFQPTVAPIAGLRLSWGAF